MIVVTTLYLMVCGKLGGVQTPISTEVVTRGRGPFGFAQGRLFDSAETSLREVPAPLRMTICGETCRAALGLDGRGARPSTGKNGRRGSTRLYGNLVGTGDRDRLGGVASPVGDLF
jgi:hypothetical protein